MKLLKLIVGVFLFLSIGLSELKAQGTLYVKEISGTQTAFVLSEIRKINFPPGNILITKSNAETQNYTLSGLQLLSFNDYTVGTASPEQYASGALRLFPNPVGNIMQIENIGNETDSRTVEILDLQGKTVQKLRLPCGQTNVDVSALKAGIYICKEQNNLKVSTTKFIKN